MPKQITDFKGSFFFLSNFWLTPITIRGVMYKSVEHAYQALKTDDDKWIERIMNAPMPVDARRIGRCIPPELIRKGWDDVRLDVMRVLVKKKFTHPALQNLLLKTEDAEIIHLNTWNDTFFGVCNGVGDNHLGKILMHVRHMLQENLQAPVPEPPKQEPKRARRKPSERSKSVSKEEHTEAPKTLLELAQSLSGRS